MTLSDIRDMYIKMAPDVFGGSMFHATNRSEAMEKIMREVFKDTKMKDIREPKYSNNAMYIYIYICMHIIIIIIIITTE